MATKVTGELTNADRVAQGIEAVMTVMARAVAGPPPRAHDELFESLRNAATNAEAQRSEDAIWALWHDHEDEDARRRMQSATQVIGQKHYEAAATLLDDMVERWPDWAEVWNKRATLRYIAERDWESLEDIAKALTIEPRHFGAISGFGQICIRAGDTDSAVVAFEQLLTIHPHLDSVKQAVVLLRQQAPRTVH